MKLQDISLEVWKDNYRATNERAHKDTWNRLALGAVEPEKESIREKIYEDFYWLLEDFKGVTGGRVTANLGVEGRNSTTLFNCYHHHPKELEYADVDSIKGIYDMLSKQALTLKSEGGYGSNFSWIRPAGMYVEGIGGRTPGCLKFMELWDKSSEIITMGSEKILGSRKPNEKLKIRKGAQMGILEIWHPEIEDFIDAKLTPNRLTKFNLSVGITDGFMEAVRDNKTWELVYPDTSFDKYKTEWFGNIQEWVEKEYPITVYKKLKARDLWDKIMTATYTRNEPGILFLGLANKLNALAYGEHIVGGNPCSEILMSSIGACCLFSINVVKFIILDEDGNLTFDVEEFKKAVKIAIRLTDNINDISRLPLPEYQQSILEKRRIGLGIMGLGSLHYMLGIPFGSDESLAFIEDVFKNKAEAEILASAKLGKEKGSFKLFDKKEYFNTHWWKTLPISDEVKKEVEAIGEMRNCHRSANAPTGNNGVYVGCVSGGIEPVFARDYTRWAIVTEKERAKLKEKGFKYPDVHKGEWFDTEYLKYVKKGDEEVLKGTFEDVEYEVDKNRGLVKGSLVEDYGWRYAKENFSEEKLKEYEEKKVFVTTEDLSVDDHINTLKIIAKYTDLNSSKTINVPKEYAYDDFKDVYMEAWKSGIKGITTYRAGTMASVLEKKKEAKEQRNELEQIFDDANGDVIYDSVSLPDEYHCKGYKIRDFNKKKWYVNVGFADKGCTKPFAIFVNTNNIESGEIVDDTVSAMFRLAKEKKIKKSIIDDQWEKSTRQSNVVKIARTIGFCLRHNIKPVDIVNVLSDEKKYPFSSFTFHLTRLLKQFIKDGTEVSGKKGVCKKCGGQLIYQEHCFMCRDCGWSKCGS